MLRHHLNAWLDLLLPRRCFGCRRSGMILCEKCASEREPADPLDAPETYALFAYRDRVVQRMIWALKYRGEQAVGIALGVLLYDYLAEELAEASLLGGGDHHFLVIPIPLTPSRERERGYNQAEVIARGFVDRANRDCGLTGRKSDNFTVAENTLKRTRDTVSQTEIHQRAKRLANVRGCFAVMDPSAVRGRQIIIVDDVITTGGTMNEARRTLESAGAKIVIAVAVAHG